MASRDDLMPQPSTPRIPPVFERATRKIHTNRVSRTFREGSQSRLNSLMFSVAEDLERTQLEAPRQKGFHPES